MKIFCTYLCDYTDRNDYYLSLMPYGITSIAAFLEKEGHEIILANLSSYGYFKGAELTNKYKPEVVAISIFSFNRIESFKYIQQLKKINKSLIIIAGGQHPTFLHDEILSRYPAIDFIIQGEGEYSIKKLIDASFKNFPRIIQSERIKNIDSIPYPSLFQGKIIGLNPVEQFKFIITSRGCPSNCTYCSSPNFWQKKATFRTPALIIEELLHLKKKYGIIYFSIRDDNFTLKKNRVLEFCRLLEKSNLYMMWNCQARVDTIDEEMLIAMKKSGLEHIQYGVESGSTRILKIYDKKITPEKIKAAASIARKVGVYMSFYLMTGMIGETEADINETKKLVTLTRPHDVIISPVAYYPGTKIYNDHKKKGLIEDSSWFRSSENGIYVTPEKNRTQNMNELLQHSSQISSRSFYKTEDFIIHRSVTGNNCWMNDIIEADSYLNTDNIKKVIQIYQHMINNFPDNIWGYLKLSEILMNDSPNIALSLLDKAIENTPSYYYGWYLKALIQYKAEQITDAYKSVKKALKLNPDNSEIHKLAHKIHKKIMH